ncbi:beta-galactosidase GalB [Sunxiuqinia dokdonensis]|uniref:beta-galactosidase GalB n=1 Tax=Sunxiuqinia dokdonensis TaxID=1409788 RepID=UPI0009EAF95C|nr:beta-galactosidase GalB [Sunxiuqinia dokdonensis]
MKDRNSIRLASLVFVALIGCILLFDSCSQPDSTVVTRERISINDGWSFYKYDAESDADSLIYDVRPEIDNPNEIKDADSKPTEAVAAEARQMVLKPWILPSANDFINDPKKKHIRPEGHPGSDFPFVQAEFDDSGWQNINLPHDWAIEGPFQTGWDSEVGGGMGRLPVNGVGWYRKKLEVSADDAGKVIYLDVDGAMSYAMVWLNGKLVGGWPYGYNSWRLDLTPYLNFGGENQLAIRVDNPNHSARWYPGAGLYRNVWLVKTNPLHVAQWGTYITSSDVSEQSANVNIEITIKNKAQIDAEVKAITEIYALDENDEPIGDVVAGFEALFSSVAANGKATVKSSVIIENPRLWGPIPTQQPNRYVAVTTIKQGGKLVDVYETNFGIRVVEFDPNQGVLVNGKHIQLKGVNQHHDLGALGAAFNTRAAERQLELLREMGCNAIRMAHNPPPPELLELTDKMGFLVIDEIFDSWETKKTPHDFHLIFPEWSEPDARSFIRRDRNHPSIILWSFGNEVGEQYTGEAGAEVAKRLNEIVKEEDPTRPTTLAMNYAKPHMELPVVPDVIGLNYQGEGIRQDPEFEGTDRIRTKPQYNAFREQFPEKVIYSSETASAFSSRGFYNFPVTEAISSIARDGRGGDSKAAHVSSYELYAVDFGSSADKVFGMIDRHPFVAGEFVWTGWDYLGEPTPYYQARSSYNGIIDLAGFPKDRFYLYQAHWRPDFPMVHILPHWNWPERIGEITPVHVFTSGDEAELFLNGKSLGRKKKADFEYRLRWDEVVYEPGELKVIAYKNDEVWAEKVVKTTGQATQLLARADRVTIAADGKDLSFVTVQVSDEEGQLVPRSNNPIKFRIDGPGEIVATDNGDQTDMTAFPSHERNAFNGLALLIVRAKGGKPGKIIVTAESTGLKEASVEIRSK